MNEKPVDLGAVERRHQEAAHPSVPSEHWRSPVGRVASDSFVLAAEVRRLREALAPFAAIAEHFAKAGMDGRRMGGLDPEELHSFHFVPGETVALRLSDCKRAKEVLGG